MKVGVTGRRTSGKGAAAGQSNGTSAPDGFQACAEAIAKRRKRLQVRRGYVRLGVRVLYLAAIAWVVLTQVLLVTQAEGNDMFPAVKDGDVVLGYRLQGDYQADDVVVYEADGQRRIGRVIAAAGDYVDMSESGSVTVNGTTVTGEVVYATTAHEGGVEYPYLVPDGCVFVLGDMRTQATDSRDFGAVPVADVEARAFTILRRRGL